MSGSAALAVLLCVTMGGCAESPSAPSAPAPLEMLPRQLSPAEVQVISASNRFAFDLLRETDARDGDGNLFLSPVSASLALGMTMNGARGETLEEMRETLGFGGLELEQINESYRGLMELLLGLDPTVDTRIANSIWYRRTFPFDQPFFDLAREYFSAEVRGIDMIPADRSTINAWVEEATSGKIPEIVDEISPDHMMFLINAIYFKGSWTERFDPAATRDETFETDLGEPVQVKMMHGSASNGITGTQELLAIDLPYGNGAFSMTILLPHVGRSVDDLVASLDAERWSEIVGALRPEPVLLALPRFRLEYDQVLNEPLKALGMVSAFTGAADFSGMSSSAGQDLEISEVLQKSFVEVNEEGTEAAAATSVGMVLSAAITPKELRIDRPFVFAIRERLTGTILFIGKVVDPS